MKLIIFEVISITIDLEVLITIGGYTKVTLREVPQYEIRHCNSAIKILNFRFLVNAFNIISRQGKYTEGIFRKEGNSGRINNINTYVGSSSSLFLNVYVFRPFSWVGRKFHPNSLSTMSALSSNGSLESSRYILLKIQKKSELSFWLLKRKT